MYSIGLLLLLLLNTHIEINIYPWNGGNCINTQLIMYYVCMPVTEITCSRKIASMLVRILLLCLQLQSIHILKQLCLCLCVRLYIFFSFSSSLFSPISLVPMLLILLLFDVCASLLCIQLHPILFSISYDCVISSFLSFSSCLRSIIVSFILMVFCSYFMISSIHTYALVLFYRESQT